MYRIGKNGRIIRNWCTPDLFGVCQVAYFIATRAETETEKIERTFDCLRGTACLENSCGKRGIAVTGLWREGEMDGLLDMKQTNEMGKAV